MDRNEGKIVEDFNTSFSMMERITRGADKKIEDLSNTVEQLGLTNTYRTVHQTAAFFSSECGIFSRMDHRLGHKTNLVKAEVIQSVF